MHGTKFSVGLTAPPVLTLDMSELGVPPELKEPLPPPRARRMAKKADQDKTATSKEFEKDERANPSDLEKLIEAVQSTK